MAKFEPVLLRNVGLEGSRALKTYRSRGGYAAARKALKEHTPEEIVEIVKTSNLRGRGGAGFPAGMKWSFLPPNRKVTYLCVNADESEPGTFNNRVLMEEDPHQLLEGLLIAGYATRSTAAYIYLRVEFHEQFHILQPALDEAYAAGLFGKNLVGTDYALECYIHRGAGAYVCGEETGLIESLEGRRGWPRIKPPFPAIEGLFRRPTVVNNVETLCCLPHIVERGADWFKSIGTPGSSGPKLYTVSGPVKRPGCYEAPLGITCRELIFGDDFAQGMTGGKQVKGCIPGGLSVGILTADELDARLDFDDLQKYGLLGLGTAGAIVIPHDADIRRVLANVTRFYAMESCGQCTQCREGTSWVHKMAQRIAAGAGRIVDLDIMLEVAGSMGMMPGLSICGLADGAAYPIRTIIEKYRAELEEHICRQEPGRVESVLRRANAAVYELPILGGGAVNSTSQLLRFAGRSSVA
jgi:NADH-quinone oxidoreductase subunit F